MKILFGIATIVFAGLAPLHAQTASSPLAGVWTLNRSQSEFPADIGFNPAWATTAARGDGQTGTPGGGASSGGGRGRRGSSGGGSRGPAPAFDARPESYEDGRRVQLLTAEVRNPPARLMIVDTPAAVTITNELGQSRTLHPDGKQESIELEGIPTPVTSKRDGDQLVVIYRVAQNREVHYTYSPSSNPARLTVDVQLFEKGTAGDKAKRVYESGVPTETRTAPAATATATPAPPAGQPAGGQAAADSFDQRPGAELKGLKSLGVLVENLSAQAAACGLNHDAIEGAVAKQLTDAGFSVRRNSDEDTYVYVNIITTMASGACVSRYDTFLYSYATAKLSYRDRPVLVQVSLIHRGGIGTSAPATHAATVGRGLQNYIDLVVTQIHDANK